MALARSAPTKAAAFSLETLTFQETDQESMLAEAVRKLATTFGRTDVDREITPAGIRDILRQIARTHPRPQVRAEAERELGTLSNG